MLWQVSHGALPNSRDLELMCNTACTSSLEALRKTQVAHCTGTDNITVRGTVYPATYTTDLLLFTYGYACLADSTGNYCFPLFQQYNSGNDTSSSDLCLACNLKTWQAVLDSPLGYSNVLAASYSSLTSSCQVTSYPVTSPTSYALGTTTMSHPSTTTTGVTPTYTCESTYTLQESDTCVSISRTKQVSTFYLLYSNKLPAFCTDFPAAGTDICIPQSCNTHTVAPWDTCASLVKSTPGLTTAQLIAYNPNLNAQCGNLRSLVGYVICLSAPGTVTTTVKVAPTTTSYFPDPCLNPGAPSSCFATSYQTTDDTPWPTHTVNISATTARRRTSTTSLPAWTDPASLPVPSGTRENCARYDTYIDVPANAKWLDCCNPNYCFRKADFWGINSTQLTEWNPSLSYNMSDDSTLASCLFKEGYGYCVAI
ncbi:LysM domain-containing protein [Diplogelasinospora grovesii]|uniref:LysM domain-containing protein n=1 Tax=Diplogelasinospora grovesii TaxID=303347 RepID=A0AAN6SAF2_9PEZI|nr:LysM domain-containing protein [Diplogelasinospora grovesii]